MSPISGTSTARAADEELADDEQRRAQARPHRGTDRITQAHGAGGAATGTLVDEVFVNAFRNELLEPLGDAAVFGVQSQWMALTTDSFVVSPLFFPGGDIGALAVNGTVNNLAVAGARALYLSAGFILEEGFAVAELNRIVASMRAAADAAGVDVVCGDTKVVPRGRADGCYVTTSGVGVFDRVRPLGIDAVRPGDAVLVSGPVGEHGAAVLGARGEIDDADLSSDTAALHGLVSELLATTSGVRVIRDAGRGGVAAVLRRFAAAAKVAVTVEGDRVPVRARVREAVAALGLQPLEVACAGRIVAVVAADAAERALAALRAHPLGEHAAVIGRVEHGDAATVTLRSDSDDGVGLALPSAVGDLLSRLC